MTPRFANARCGSGTLLGMSSRTVGLRLFNWNKVMTAGIYSIVSLKTDRNYIGQSCNIRRRWYEHRSALRSGHHHSRLLQEDWDKFGEASFFFVELCSMDSSHKALMN